MKLFSRWIIALTTILIASCGTQEIDNRAQVEEEPTTFAEAFQAKKQSYAI